MENPSRLGVGVKGRKSFGTVLTTHMLIEIFLLMAPALVPVFQSEFHLAVFDAGLLISIPSICRLAITLPVGVLVDRYGSKRLIVLSLILCGFSAFFISQTSNVQSLIIGLSLIMMAVTVYHPPGLSVLNQLSSNSSQRSKAVGWHNATGNLGQAVGTISLGLLLSGYGWRATYLLFSVPVLLFGIVAFRARFPSAVAKLASAPVRADGYVSYSESAVTAPLRRFVLTRGFLMLLGTMSLFALANGAVISFMTKYMTAERGVGDAFAAMILGGGPLIGILGSLLGGYVSSRLGDKRALILLYSLQALFLTLLVLSSGLILLVVTFLAFQLFMSSIWTPANCLVASLTHSGNSGVAYSMYFFAHDTFNAVAPVVAAGLITGLGIDYIFPFAVVILVVNVLLTRMIHRRT